MTDTTAFRTDVSLHGISNAAHNMALPVAALIVTLVWRVTSPQCVDISGLLTMAERLLEGDRPYIDFIEINPPGSFLIYLPAVLFSRAFGLRPEAWVELHVLALLGWSLWLCWRISKDSPVMADVRPQWLCAVAIVVLGLLPTRTFGEREHIGVIALLPMLTAAAVMCHGRVPALQFRLMAGLGGGLALIAKPHLVLPMAGAFAVVAWHTRSWRRAFDPLWFATAALALAYLAWCAVAYPAFFSVGIPLVVETYLPDRRHWTAMLPLPPSALLLMFAVGFGAGARQHFFAPTTVILLVGTALAFLALVLQGKGWPYHSYPAIAFLALAVGWHWANTASSIANWITMPASLARSAVSVSFSVVCLALAISFLWFSTERNIDTRGLAALIERDVKQPRMVALTEDVAVGHPLVRDINGRWIQSVPSLWPISGSMFQLRNPGLEPSRRAKLLDIIQKQIDLLARDIATGRPDVILIDVPAEGRDWLAWARSQAAIAPLLDAYREAGRVGEIVVMVRVRS